MFSESLTAPCEEERTPGERRDPRREEGGQSEVEGAGGEPQAPGLHRCRLVRASDGRFALALDRPRLCAD